ncbi:MAG TPA: DUF952 domain-containing protein [Streptosporangiaceae bacterium]|nr:DUF952 domain-containing protein [Streptosporangiaceae bacterium]
MGVAVYHIAFSEDWAEAARVGEYTISTRGLTLEQQGFIHASDAHQVALVANSFYLADDGLIALVIDTDRLRSPVRYEKVPGSDEPFPHIYGPINVDAVIATTPLERGSDGRFSFTPAE